MILLLEGVEDSGAIFHEPIEWALHLTLYPDEELIPFYHSDDPKLNEAAGLGLEWVSEHDAWLFDTEKNRCYLGESEISEDLLRRIFVDLDTRVVRYEMESMMVAGEPAPGSLLAVVVRNRELRHELYADLVED